MHGFNSPPSSVLVTLYHSHSLTSFFTHSQAGFEITMSLSDLFSFAMPAGQDNQSFAFGTMANHEFTRTHPLIPDEQSNTLVRRRSLPDCTPSMIGMSDDEDVRTRPGLYVKHPTYMAKNLYHVRYLGDRGTRTERGMLLEDSINIDSEQSVGHYQRGPKRKRSTQPLTCNPRDACTFVDLYESSVHWDSDSDDDSEDEEYLPVSPANRVVAPTPKKKKVKTPARPTRISTREIFPNPKYFDLPIFATPPRKRNVNPIKTVSSPSNRSPSKRARFAKDTLVDEKSASKGRKTRPTNNASPSNAIPPSATSSVTSPSKAARTVKRPLTAQPIEQLALSYSRPASTPKRVGTLKTPAKVPAIVDTAVVSASEPAPAVSTADGPVSSSFTKNSEAVLTAKEETRDSRDVDTQLTSPTKSSPFSYSQFWAGYYRCYLPQCSRIFTETRFIRDHIRYEHSDQLAAGGQTFRCGYSNCPHWGASIEVIEKHQQVFPGHNGNLPICPTYFRSY